MVRRKTPLLLWFTVWFLLFLGAPGSITGNAADPPDSRSDIPPLRLTADRTIGFSPLEVTIHGSFKGSALKDANFCHPGTTWQVWSLTSSEVLRSSQNPKCHHRGYHLSIPFTFTNKFTLGRGIHLCRLTVRGKDGTTLTSNLIRVRVY